MNKEKIQERVDALEAELEGLKKELEKPEELTWEPDINDDYYMIKGTTKLHKTSYNASIHDLNNVMAYNAFYRKELPGGFGVKSKVIDVPCLNNVRIIQAFDQRTLGVFIKALETIEDKTKPVIFSDGKPFGYPHSYRGFYQDLAITDEGRSVNVSDVIHRCNICIGDTYEGYKGGEFTMDENSILWRSNYGESSGIAVVGLCETDKAVVVLTIKIELDCY